MVDSNYSTPLLEKYVNLCIDSLETVEYLKTNSYSKGLDFCNLASCFGFLKVYDDDTLLNQAIFERLKQIAQRFHLEGTPILLHGGGMNNIESCKALNEQGNPYGITYVSLGNSCLTYGLVDKAIQKFNEETKRLVNYQVSESKKQKRIRKKNVVKQIKTE
tara:strand:+ start:543 stop:1025 length:483 start_codon:yes stop_codon:yes gene_type:complete